MKGFVKRNRKTFVFLTSLMLFLAGAAIFQRMMMNDDFEDVAVVSVETKGEEEQNNENSLEGLTFVITGKLKFFKNRDMLKELIENLGGVVSSSVTSKTDYLINNDVMSNTAKNVAAQRLNKPIVTEEEFLNLFNIKI